jgi:hypothetical protein
MASRALIRALDGRRRNLTSVSQLLSLFLCLLLLPNKGRVSDVRDVDESSQLIGRQASRALVLSEDTMFTSVVHGIAHDLHRLASVDMEDDRSVTHFNASDRCRE